MSDVRRGDDVTAPEAVRREDVARRLARYDLDRNHALARMHPRGQYPHTRRCAVLVPLFFHPSDGRLHVLLTVRSSTLRTHASHVAFPGGAQDASDADDVHTALREAHEEVGLPAGDVTVVARLPPVFVFKMNSVFPIVGFIPSDFVPRPNPHEVTLVFSVPLANFVRDGAVTYKSYHVHGQGFTTAYLTHHVTSDDQWSGSGEGEGGGGGVSLNVWGVTCNICITVARTILGPSKRLRMTVRDEEGRDAGGDGGTEAGEASARRQVGDVDGGGGGDGHDDDDDVFGDMVSLYHKLCTITSRIPSGRL